MQDAPAGDNFQFARDYARALCPAHEMANGAGVFGAYKFFKCPGILGGAAEDLGDGGIEPDDVALGVERKSAGRNVFKDGLDKLASSFEFTHGLLEIVRELIDLRARVAELGGHAVEGADKIAELVVRLLGNLVVKIARGDFAGAFGQCLDGTGYLLREIERDPKHGREKQDGEEGEDQEELAFKGAQVLFFLIVGHGLPGNLVETREKVRGHRAGRVVRLSVLRASRADDEQHPTG